MNEEVGEKKEWEAPKLIEIKLTNTESNWAGGGGDAASYQS